ncbi:hypothetical protein APHAL10511_002376 [Amanita phalloides]|nr:hypothetical protein APHAL10511_002376 [Amanita phalloides]
MLMLYQGPIAGGTIGSEHPDVPRAVSKEFFNEVCPDKFVVDANAMKSELEGATGDQTTRAWVMKLRDVGHRCVEIPKGSSHIFDNVMFGESRLLDVWSELSTSPVLRRFAWSPLVLDAYNRNRHVFEYGANRTTIDHSGHLHGLLVVHIRRGDFKGHCKYLQKHSSGYNAFNLFPEFSDRFEPPSEYWSRTTYYTNHCYPSIKRMLFKIEDVQQRQHTLRRLHIMTNAKKPWLGRLVTELDRTSSWDVITTSRDLNLTREQKYASQALDALIAQRAEAFIGNGSHVKHQHVTDGGRTRSIFDLLLVIPHSTTGYARSQSD